MSASSMPVASAVLRWPTHWLLGALCAGVALANGARATSLLGVLLVAVAVGGLAQTASGGTRLALLAVSLTLFGWAWGSARLEALDRSVLTSQVDKAERSLVLVTGPARRTQFQTRVQARALRFGSLRLGEPLLLKLPLGRSPPQGALLELVGQIALPAKARNGFDERRWLRRHGVHVVMKADRWQIVGHRGGLAGFADHLRVRLARSVAPGLHGEQRAVLLGVVLGQDERLSEELRQKFRASGLYHLLAVSGQNVALVAAGVLMIAWLLGVSRWIGEIGALAAIGGYVLVVGPQPSVIRAGIAGALGSLAWLVSRARDRCYFLLLGGLALLGWNPYVLFDPGFQLSFAAVAAIFVFVPRLQAALRGYPMPRPVADVLSVSAVCGAATAPILWFQFHAIPLLTVPANALAAPALVPLLGLGLATAALHPLLPGASAALASVNGLFATYLAGCARVVAALPGAQIRSGWVAASLAATALAAAYAWRRWQSSSPSTC